MDIKNLYRDIIMDHYKNPRNKGLIEADGYHTVRLHNPSCGDDILLSVLFKDGVIKDIRHDGKGCSICCSSASVLTELVKGDTLKDAKEKINTFSNMLLGVNCDLTTLKDAVAYKGVLDFPARIKCASLAWKCLEKAIDEKGVNND